MFLVLLGALDIFVSILIITKIFKSLLFIFGILWLLKGFWSVFSGAVGGFLLDILGWLDIIAGGCLLALNFGFEWGGFVFVGIFVLLKGFYSIAMGI